MRSLLSTRRDDNAKNGEPELLWSAGQGHLFAAGEVAGSPEVPTGDGAPGLPFFCSALHGVGFGEVHGSDFVSGFELAEGEGEAFADAVVVDG